VIAKSDFVILLVSLTVLGGGIYRWQTNYGAPPAVTVPASLQSSVRAPSTNENVVASEPRIIEETTAPRTIVVNSNGTTPSATVPASDVNANIDATVTGSSVSDAASGEPLYGVHKIVYGDYLGRIAQRYNTSTSELRRINNISGSDIYVGQEIRYPLPAN